MVRLEFNCTFNCSPKPFDIFIVSSMKLITLIISTFFWRPSMLLEAFECCARKFDAAWLLLFSLLLELFLRYCTSCFSCLIWSFNDSSSFCFVDEFDLDGAFSLVLLMFSNLIICMVSYLLGWILVSLDFILITVLLFVF